MQDKITASMEYKGHFAFAFDGKICYNISANLLARRAKKIKFYNAETLELVHKTKYNFSCTEVVATDYNDFAYIGVYGVGFFSIFHKVVDHELFKLKFVRDPDLDLAHNVLIFD